MFPNKETVLTDKIDCPFCDAKRLKRITAYDIELKRRVLSHYWCKKCGRNVQLDEISQKPHLET